MQSTRVHHPVRGFPRFCIASEPGNSPIEVTLIAEVGGGMGNSIVHAACARQRGHSAYENDFGEASAQLGSPHFAAGNPSSLYSFSVDENGHPFHRHQGNRMFTAISGSSGSQLRFAATGSLDVEAHPQAFMDALHFVDIPADCIFTVRFGRNVWHQFVPQKLAAGDPALFAISCHPDELTGIDDEASRAQILAGNASIPALTTVLPEATQDYFELRMRAGWVPRSTQTTALAFASNEPRAALGRVCQSAVPVGSLLQAVFPNEAMHHQDNFNIELPLASLKHEDGAAAQTILATLLDAFLHSPPKSVGMLMRMRNALVKPAGLRTSDLGCPVSSLRNTESSHLFVGRFPVHAFEISEDGKSAQVLLGADDKHLRFRSCVAVHLQAERVVLSLGTRVQCKNWFGRFYMAAIHHVHLLYVAPTMLRHAACELSRTSLSLS